MTLEKYNSKSTAFIYDGTGCSTYRDVHKDLLREQFSIYSILDYSKWDGNQYFYVNTI